MEIKQEFFQKFIDCKWLENCGKDENSTYDFKVMKVSKKEALKRIMSLKWRNTCLDAQNDLTGYLFINKREELNLFWNKQVEKLHAEYYPQIEVLIKPKAEEMGLSEEFIADIRINFIRIMMNHYYSEYFEEEFLNRLMVIYLSGHIPCGITGNRKNGTIMIY